MAAADDALYLAIDQGSHASRAMVYDGRGGLRARAHVAVKTQQPRPDWFEHDAAGLLGATRDAVAASLRELGPAVRQLAAAGLATQRSSIVCWDRDTGQALSPVISWRDRRAADWLATFAGDARRIHAITGLVLSPHYGASKLRWCLDHLPRVAASRAAGHLACGPLSSFLVHHLCADRPDVVDPANASRTLLWDYRRRDWSPELLELFGLPRDCLPRSVPSRGPFGRMALEASACPLTVVTGDQSAALFAAGEPAPDTLYVNLGTGAFLQQAVGGNPVTAPGLLSSVVYQDAHRSLYVLEGTVNGAGGAVDDLARELGLDNDTVQTSSAAWLDSIDAPPLFLNGVGGIGSPFWVAEFPSQFVGTGSPPAQIVAVLESIVFLLQVNLDVFARHAQPARRIVVTGGLAAVDPLCQRLADLAGLAVQRPVFREGTARGLACLLADLPVGWSMPSGQAEFQPAARPELRQRYARWRAAMDRALAAR